MWLLKFHRVRTTPLVILMKLTVLVDPAVQQYFEFLIFTVYCFLKNNVRDSFFERCGVVGGVGNEVGQRKPRPHGFHQRCFP